MPHDRDRAQAEKIERRRLEAVEQARQDAARRRDIEDFQRMSRRDEINHRKG